MLSRIRILLVIAGLAGGGFVVHEIFDNGDPSQAQIRLELARKFAPVLYLSPTDYQPREVAIFLPGGMLAGESACRTALRSALLPTSMRDCPAARNLTDMTAVFPDVPDALFIDIKAARVGEKEKYFEAYQRIKDQYKSVTYAHVVGVTNDREEDGEWAEVWIEYWFFYYYDDFFRFDHEGDWERIVVRIPATSLKDARDNQPVAVQYSQHVCDGSEKMLAKPWTKELAPGNHPIVYVARGSHANYFTNGFAGIHSGLPCTVWDRTFRSEPPLKPTPVLIACGDQTDHDFAWLEYKGYWGEGRKARGPCR